jgi:ech hydrogenase subunit A
MNWIVFLILFPLLPAVLLLLFRSERVRQGIVLAASACICIGVVGLAVTCSQGPPQGFRVGSDLLNKLVTGGDIVLALVFLYICRHLPLKKYWIPLLVVVQYGVVVWCDLSGRVPASAHPLFVDNLSVILALIIGIIGCLIAVYTLGYMKHYHEKHPDVPDRRGQFLAAIFLFFFAMFGIIFSNSVPWIYFFWEITTLCSFVMIGYARNDEARDHAFRALWMLLLGGAAFAAAILVLSDRCGTVDLQEIVTRKESVALFPVLLLCFAGLNKSAQFPFTKWLLGAMVAPTPSSALLHSSTMVKAGVYIVIRCAPVLEGTAAGAMVAFVGGLSFLAGSALAISQRDGKAVLAYSTVGNLGLIILCAGIGSKWALWAAVLLILFHALSKALLFLCVGTVEQQTGSRDIEEMHGLISRMPLLTLIMLVGVAGMFLAPFGMLISKWAVLEALANRNPVYPPIVIFGGSMMLFFWAKWMGTLVAVTGPQPNQEKGIGVEWVALGGLAVLSVLACGLYPLVGIYLIEPLYGYDPMLSRGVEKTVGLMLGLMLLLPLGFLVHWKNLVHVEPYLSGANVDDPHRFMGSLGTPREWAFHNYYLREFFSEEKLFRGTLIGSIAVILLMFFVEKL